MVARPARSHTMRRPARRRRSYNANTTVWRQRMERGELHGKAAIVTGSATGIGAAVAIGLARLGAKVVVNYSKSEKEARATADAVRDAGGEALLVQGNVASDADCRKIA